MKQIIVASSTKEGESPKTTSISPTAHYLVLNVIIWHVYKSMKRQSAKINLNLVLIL